MANAALFLLVLLSLIAQAESVDMRTYLPKGKYVDSERGCQVEVTHESGKVKIGFSVSPNPFHAGASPQDYVIGGKSWIELDAKTGRVTNGDSTCWTDQEKGPETQIQEERFIYGNSCTSEHTQAEKVQLHATHGQFSGLLYQREIFRLRPSSTDEQGLIYEGLEQMHFGCKLTPELTIGSVNDPKG